MPKTNYETAKQMEAIIYKINRCILNNYISNNDLQTIVMEINNCYKKIKKYNQKLYVETFNLNVIAFKNYFQVTI